MNRRLFFHELKTELIHHRGFIVLWWVLVVLHLGYQTAWWGGDGTGGLSYQFHHSFSESLDLAVLCIGLILFPILLFAPASPEKRRSVRVRPVPDWVRIAARLAFLVLAVGLPWWLHEAIYLHSTAVSAGFIAAAVGERIFFSLLCWFCAGTFTWCTENVWKTAGMVFAGYIAFVGIALAFPSTTSDPAPPIAHYVHDLYAISYPHLWVFSAALVATALWIGWKWRRRTGGPAWIQWAPFIVAVLFSTRVHMWIVDALSTTVRRMATAEERIEEIASYARFALNPETTRYIRQNDWGEDERTPYWEIHLSSSDHSPSISARIREASGTWRWPNGSAVFFPPRWEQERKRSTDSELRFLHEKIVEMTGTHPLVYSPLGSGGGGIGLRGIDDEAPLSMPQKAEAGCAIELTEMGNWMELPLDREWHEFGSFGRARFLRWNGDRGFEIECHPRRLFFDWKNGVTPRQVLGLWNPKTDEWIDLGAVSPDNANKLRGRFSASPRVRRYISIDPYERKYFPNIDDLESWLWSGARLFLLEARYLGRIEKNLADEEIPDFQWRRSLTRMPLQLFSHENALAIADERKQPPSDPTEAETRRWLYQLAMGVGFHEDMLIDPDPFRVESVPEAHRGLLREMVELNLNYDQLFRDVWTEADRPWLLRVLQDKDPAQFHYHYLLGHAARNGWLDDQPALVGHLVEQLGNDAPDDLITVAKRFSIPRIEEIEFRQRLSFALSRPRKNVGLALKAQYPQVWEELEEENRAKWEKDKWKLPFNASYSSNFRPGLWTHGLNLSRLTGDPEPLRAVLDIISRGALRLPFEKSHGPSYRPDVAPIWNRILFALNQPHGLFDTAPENRARLAKQWLESQWTFDPLTLTFRLEGNE